MRPRSVFIDDKENMYICAINALKKYDKAGNVLWSSDVGGADAVMDEKGYIYTIYFFGRLHDH